MGTSLNPKERQRLAELHACFKGGTFSETDVSALLVLLREKSNAGPIKELAHSIAHSERNSGEFFQRVRENQSLLNDLGKHSGILDARYIFSDSEFVQNLNEALRRHGFHELDSRVIDLIFLCCLSLLQGGSVKDGKTFGELHLALTGEHFELRADMPIEHNGKTARVVFPVAGVANRWLPVCNPRAHVDSSGPVVVKVENFGSSAQFVGGIVGFDAAQSWHKEVPRSASGRRACRKDVAYGLGCPVSVAVCGKTRFPSWCSV